MGDFVGVDPELISRTAWASLKNELSSYGQNLVSVEHNLIDAIWTDRPTRTLNTVFHHAVIIFSCRVLIHFAVSLGTKI